MMRRGGSWNLTNRSLEPFATSARSESVGGRLWRSRRGTPMGGGGLSPVPRVPFFFFRGSVAGGTYPTAPFVKEAHSPCALIVCRHLPPPASLRQPRRLR